MHVYVCDAEQVHKERKGSTEFDIFDGILRYFCPLGAKSGMKEIRLSKTVFPSLFFFFPHVVREDPSRINEDYAYEEC